MKKKWASLLVVLFMVFSNLSGISQVSALESNTEALEETQKYEIYPLPQKQTYLNTELSITDNVNVVIENTIDEATTNFLIKILQSKSINYAISNAVVSEKTNIIIGTRNSAGYVDAYFNNKIQYTAETFTHEDAYVLEVNGSLEGKGTIAILGKNTDAAYYGLATLKMILDQIPGKIVKSVKYEDYSDAKWRGFIEGFYGFPWSHEDRMSLMRFGGNFKMNSYIFAPKDDQYHNSAWRTLYPAAELAKVKELVDVGHESKTQFIWAIHPGMNMINFNDYANELNTLLAKLNQLYSVGVRQFGLFMDDISTSQSLTDKDKHVKLITDVANWIKAKGNCKALIYCPPFYNQSWTGSTGRPYLEALAAVPENVEIMWTGSGVCGTVNSTDMQWPKDAHGKNPFVWLNWPVNDYKDSRLLLGKGEVMIPGTHNIAGIVSNPMGHAELSKIALFAVADFTWNSDDFDDDQSWQDSFKYINSEAATELNTIAYHMSDVAPSGHGLQLGESENIKDKLNSFLSKFSKEEPLQETGNDLVGEFDNILNAIRSFKEKNQNANMLEEINPWLNCLTNVAEACKYASNSAMAIDNDDLDLAWEELAKATNSMSKSKTYTIKKLKYADVTVEAGAKRLVPFVNQLISKLDTKIYTAISPNAVIPTAISSYGAYSGLDKIIDGKTDTNVYIQTIQVNGDWYGVDFGKVIKVADIEILQGRTDADHDIFQRGILEYSKDGETWTAIGEERSGYKISVKGLDIEARYIRYRLTHAGIPGGKADLWTAVREFTVNANKGKVTPFTNVPELKETVVSTTGVSAEISNLTNITLKASQYIGIKLLTIEKIAEIAMEGASSELKLESSENGVEWTEVTSGGSYKNAAYVRIINKSSEDITFNLTRLSVKFNKFAEPVVTHNYNSVYSGILKNLYDGKLEDKVWFNGMQYTGKYVQVDMGGIVDVQNIAVVINDGEGDYFRKGDLQISLDGTTWQTVHSFANPGDKTLNFPEHEVPYRYKRVQVGGKQARYVRLICTENTEAWFALNEILVNEGIGRPGAGNTALIASPEGNTGSESTYAIDNKLSTSYTPKGEAVPGYLNYKISDNTALSKVIILQSPSGISNAKVSVRDTKGWHEVGALAQSSNSIDTSKYENVLEVKIEWQGSVKPIINEIIAVARNGEFEQPVDFSGLESAISVAQTKHDTAEIGTEEGQYPQAAVDALAEAIIAAKAVRDSEASTQEEVDAAVITLNSAVTTFESQVVSAENKTALIREIATAQAKYNSVTVGTAVGQCPKTAKYALLAAINVANAVKNNANSTEINIAAAVKALKNAVTTFEASIIK